MNVAALKTRLEAELGRRFAAPFSPRPPHIETVSSGIPEMDALAGGLPRGCLTEISGAVCSGRTSLLVSILAAMTGRAEICALVDGRDAFDPEGARAAGIELNRLLWVRCGNIEQSLKAADLLLHSGGFGLLALDLSDIPAQIVRRVPLSTWFRLRRMVENTPTVLVLLEQEACAKTCAALVLRLGAEAPQWSAATEPHLFSAHATHRGRITSIDRAERNARGMSVAPPASPDRGSPSLLSLAHGEVPRQALLWGARLTAEVLRCRMEQADGEAGRLGSSALGRMGDFETHALWQMIEGKHEAGSAAPLTVNLEVVENDD